MAALIALVVSLAGTRAAAAPLDAADRAAWAKARRVVDDARSEEHRRCVTLRWSSAPSRLPAAYRVELHAEYAALHDLEWTIDIERTARSATVRVFDESGIRTATIRTRALDAWARTAIHLTRVEEAATCVENMSFGSVSHMPSRTLAIETVDEVLMETPHVQPYLERLDEEDDGTELFASSWAIHKLEAIARQAVDRVAPEPVDLAGLRAVLRDIPRGDPPASSPHREDRDAVQARLSAHHLQLHGERRDVDLLLRKGFEHEAFFLSLRHVADEDLPDVAASMLCSSDSELVRAGLEAAQSLGERGRTALLAGLRCEPGTEYYSYVPSIVEQLKRLGGHDAATLTALRRAGRRNAKPEVRVAVAAALWTLDRDRDQLDVLAKVGASEVTKEMSDWQRAALRHLSTFARREPALKAELAPYFAEVLHAIPLTAHPTFGGIDMMVGIVSDLGGQTYDAEYRRVLAHDSSDAVLAAIRAIEAYDKQAAAREALVRVEKHNAGEVDGAIYSWNVLPYLALFIETDATHAVAALEDALVLLRKSYERDAWKLGTHAATLAYLRARTRKQRAAAALAFIRADGPQSSSFEAHCMSKLGLTEADLERAERQHDRDAAARELP